MVLAGGLFAAGQIGTIGLLSETETKILLAPKIGTAVLGTALNFAAGYYCGLSGVVYAVTFSAAVYVSWIILLTRQRQQTRQETD